MEGTFIYWVEGPDSELVNGVRVFAGKRHEVPIKYSYLHLIGSVPEQIRALECLIEVVSERLDELMLQIPKSPYPNFNSVKCVEEGGLLYEEDEGI